MTVSPDPESRVAPDDHAGWPRPDACPRLAPEWQVRDAGGEEPVLDGSGGAITLNATAAAILARCDGRHSIGQLVEELERSFDAEGIAEEVLAFLRTAHERGWVR